MAALYVVATPIGNLEDITLRALRLFKEVDVILCEDTRITKRLLSRYEITTPVMAYHAHSTPAQHNKILDLLREGKQLALVTDAGTPGISDPGSKLVEMVREVLGGIPVVSIPGASALTAALSVSGQSSSDFIFMGFLPHKKGREKLVTEILSQERLVVLYESPHRIERLLKSIREKDPPRLLLIARELTKIHEEVLKGTAEELLLVLENTPEKKQGEFVVMVIPR